MRDNSIALASALGLDMIVLFLLLIHCCVLDTLRQAVFCGKEAHVSRGLDVELCRNFHLGSLDVLFICRTSV